jgi:hypothetical protein
MNPFRTLLQRRDGPAAVGTWLMSASPLVAEAVGHAGFDWGVVDMEHTPLDLHGRWCTCCRRGPARRWCRWCACPGTTP